jgi:hypothetical protein
MRCGSHETMLDTLSARNGNPTILDRVGGVESSDALEGNACQIRW